MVRLLLLCTLAPLWSTALATVLRVRAEFATIQTALDSSHDHDTILVELGTYVEALQAPPHFVYLLGAVDSADGEKPEINPSNLHGSDSLAGIFLPEGASLVIRNFLFRNDAIMYPRFGWPETWLSGGIRYATNQYIEVTNCVFDSVFAAIRYAHINARPDMLVEDCDFSNCPGHCMYSRGPLTLRDSQFNGLMNAGVACLDSGLIENCHFSGSASSWLALYRCEHVVRQCTFGPGECTWSPIESYACGTNRIENCDFHDIGAQGMLFPLYMRHPSTMTLADNTFRDCYLLRGLNAPIGIGDAETETRDDSVIVTNCRFERMATSSSTQGWPKILELQNEYGSVRIEGNHFIANPPETAAVILSDSGQFSVIRNNVFLNNGWAVWNWGQLMDARHNFWGDSTGPYHSTLNPEGRGDEIRGEVFFEPWYPDSNLLAIPESNAPVPSTVALSVYPNPFNSETRIQLSLPFPADISVNLFDITGRFGEKIWAGYANGSRTITWNAHALPSGIYFIRADENLNRFSVTTKAILIK
jgi:hypothetical protein